MVIDVREHELVDSGACELTQVGGVVRASSAVAKDWNSRKALDERGERGPHRLVLRIARLGQQACDVTRVLGYRRVKVGDAVHDVHGRWAKGRRHSHTGDAITYQGDDRRRAHLHRLPLG
ncbi:MAG TPA: hypothetical protein VF461_20870 [Gemmatimonadaceae bacterium]